MKIKEFIGPISTVAAALIISVGAYVTLNQFAPKPPPEPPKPTSITFTITGTDTSDYTLIDRESIYKLENKYQACEAKLPEKERDKSQRSIWTTNPGDYTHTTPTYTMVTQ